MHGSDAQTARRACDLASPYIDPLKAIVLAPRLALFVPEARFRRAMAASAGRYAFPSWSETFPYGLDGSPIDRMLLTKAFSRDLVVLLGDRDVTDREREAGSMEQGTTRAALELLRP